MRTFLIAIAALLLSSSGQATEKSKLYVKAYGDSANQPVIFVHGGPPHSSLDFEVTTAEKLAQKGFYVVVFDQRGQGRSDETDPSQYSYQIYADDIKSMIDSMKLHEPILIGHSHGGPISIAFDRAYPGVAKKIVLAAAPIDFWAAMQSLFESCAIKYSKAGDEEKLSQISFVKMKLTYDFDSLTDDERVFFVGSAFGHAMHYCKLYSPSQPTAESIALWKLVTEHSGPGPGSGATTAMPGFLKNEDYIHKNQIEHVYAERSRYCGIYGDEDGLFTPLSLGVIKLTLNGQDEAKRFSLLRGASHSVYIDQQDAFLNALKTTCGLQIK